MESQINNWIKDVIKSSGNQAGVVLSQLHRRARDQNVSAIIAFSQGKESDLDYYQLKCDLLNQALQAYLGC